VMGDTWRRGPHIHAVYADLVPVSSASTSFGESCAHAAALKMFERVYLSIHTQKSFEVFSAMVNAGMFKDMPDARAVVVQCEREAYAAFVARTAKAARSIPISHSLQETTTDPNVALDAGTIANARGMVAHLNELACANTVVRTMLLNVVTPKPTHAPPTVMKQGEEEKQLTASAPGWADLGDAKRSVLIVLSKANERMPGEAIAKKAGYSYGTLRHHFPELQTWNYIDKTMDGYAITPTGAALVPCESV